MTAPTEVVKAFLAAMSRRDFAGMEALMAPGFRMTVTGGEVYTHPKDFAAASGKRQKSARKTTDHYDEIATPDGGIVYSIGSMAGEWNTGAAYAGIRYIDRFEIENGKIRDMQVFSDMAEFRPKP
ncbi:MAG: nuclear transport factor 2 family protein [Rhodospirillaceae bacterium]|nr:nuclear transport factor 2 family protein [Rhodospirillaceae bacterium]